MSASEPAKETASLPRARLGSTSTGKGGTALGTQTSAGILTVCTCQHTWGITMFISTNVLLGVVLFHAWRKLRLQRQKYAHDIHHLLQDMQALLVECTASRNFLTKSNFSIEDQNTRISSPLSDPSAAKLAFQCLQAETVAQPQKLEFRKKFIVYKAEEDGGPKAYKRFGWDELKETLRPAHEAIAWCLAIPLLNGPVWTGKGKFKSPTKIEDKGVEAEKAEEIIAAVRVEARSKALKEAENEDIKHIEAKKPKDVVFELTGKAKAEAETPLVSSYPPMDDGYSSAGTLNDDSVTITELEAKLYELVRSDSTCSVPSVIAENGRSLQDELSACGFDGESDVDEDGAITIAFQENVQNAQMKNMPVFEHANMLAQCKTAEQPVSPKLEFPEYK